MARKKKSDIDILCDILEGSELTTNDLKWFERIVRRRIRNREVSAETKIVGFPDAGKKRETEKTDGGRPGKSSGGTKD